MSFQKKSGEFFSPAKLNLFLKILGKRSDGYHELYTLFHRLSLKDRLWVEKRLRGFEIECDHPEVPRGRRNILYRAYELLAREAGLDGGVYVFLDKKIPVAGGLGGGSSNAATLILALNRLFRLHLSLGQCLHLGKKLGSDVPFFLTGFRQALGRGRGEEVSPVPTPKNLWFQLTILPFGISTQSAYASFSLDSELPSLTKVTCDATMLSAFLASRNIRWIARLLANDLLESSRKIKPAIGRVLYFLRRLAPASMMSGSGPTLYSILATRSEAEAVASSVKKRFGFRTLVCQTG